MQSKTLAEAIGPWADPDFESGLIKTCREAWDKSFDSLSRREVAVLLRQKVAIPQLLPVASALLESEDDDTEVDEGELSRAIVFAQENG